MILSFMDGELGALQYSDLGTAACVCVCMCVCVYIYIYIHMYSVCACVYIYIYIYIFFFYLSLSLYIYIYIHAYIYTSIYLCSEPTSAPCGAASGCRHRRGPGACNFLLCSCRLFMLHVRFDCVTCVFVCVVDIYIYIYSIILVYRVL